MEEEGWISGRSLAVLPHSVPLWVRRRMETSLACGTLTVLAVILGKHAKCVEP